MGWPKQHLASLTLALLVAVVLFGAWLRFRGAGDSLWLDELHTAWTAQASGEELIDRAAMGNQSPLYYQGVAVIGRLLGPSEFSLRLLSLVAGSLLPVAVWGLARRTVVWDGQAGCVPYVPLLAAWLAAVDPLAIFYAQESRPYACVQLLAVAHVWILVELLDKPSIRKRIAWIGCGGLLFYLHYTAALVVIAEVVFVLGWLIVAKRRTGQFDRREFSSFTLDVGCLVLLTLPALPPLLEIYERRQNWALFVPRVGLTELAELPRMIPWSVWGLVYPAVYAVALATSHPLSLRERARGRERSAAMETSTREAAAHTECAGYFASAAAPSTWLLLTWLTIPVVFVAITSSADWLRLWHVRYLIGVTPATLLLAAMLPRLAPRRFGVGIAIALALYAAWSSHQTLDWLSLHGRPQRSENWHAAVDYLNAQSDRHPILLRSGLIEADALRDASDPQLIEYCRFPLTALYRVDRPEREIHPLTMTEAGRLTPALRDAMKPDPGETESVWLVVRGDAARADLIARELQQTFATQAMTIDASEERSFGRVQVRLLKLQNNAESGTNGSRRQQRAAASKFEYPG